MSKLKYKIVFHSMVQGKFVSAVQKELDKGWELQGGAFTSYSGQLAQTLVKRKGKDKRD